MLFCSAWGAHYRKACFFCFFSPQSKHTKAKNIKTVFNMNLQLGNSSIGENWINCMGKDETLWFEGMDWVHLFSLNRAVNWQNAAWKWTKQSIPADRNKYLTNTVAGPIDQWPSQDNQNVLSSEDHKLESWQCHCHRGLVPRKQNWPFLLGMAYSIFSLSYNKASKLCTYVQCHLKDLTEPIHS